MTLKIAIVGPESTGKSTLARQLAEYFDATLVDEYAREFLMKLGRNYTEEDLDEIMKGQIHLEDLAITEQPKMIICDTNLVVMKIWGIFQFGRSSDLISSNRANRKYDLQILMKPDLPWEKDELRENPHDLEELFDLYDKDLREAGDRYVVIGGIGLERMNKAVAAIRSLEL